MGEASPFRLWFPMNLGTGTGTSVLEMIKVRVRTAADISHCGWQLKDVGFESVLPVGFSSLNAKRFQRWRGREATCMCCCIWHPTTSRTLQHANTLAAPGQAFEDASGRKCKYMIARRRRHRRVRGPPQRPPKR